MSQDEHQIAAVTKCKSQSPFDFPFSTIINWEGSDGSTSNTPFIIMSPGVEYCVTATDPIGCEYVECIDYECEIDPVACETPEDFGCYGWGNAKFPTFGRSWAEWICINSQTRCPFRTFAPDDIQLRTSGDITDLQIAPNPTSDIIYLSGENITQGAIISIYDLQGRLVLDQKIQMENQLSRSLENLNPAVYVLIIRNQNGMIVEEAKISKM